MPLIGKMGQTAVLRPDPSGPPRRTGSQASVVMAGLLSLFAVIQCWLPLKTAIQIGADEGFELAKATLCLKGYKLYAEVWNDQPPLHTFLVTQVLRHLSRSIVGPRLVTSVFTAILLASIFSISLRVNGLLVATLTAGLLIASPGFVELSSSCMLEIPALTPTVAALSLLLVVRRSKLPIAEILAGVLFGLAFQIKLINVVLLPLAALIVWQRYREAETKRPEIVRSSLVMAASLAVSFVITDYLVDGGAYLQHFEQSWSSHFGSVKALEYGSPNEHPFDWSVLLKDWDTTIPAVLGIIFL